MSLQGLRCAQGDRVQSLVATLKRRRIGSPEPTANAGQNGQSVAFLESVAVALNRWLEKKDVKPSQ